MSLSSPILGVEWKRFIANLVFEELMSCSLSAIRLISSSGCHSDGTHPKTPQKNAL